MILYDTKYLQLKSTPSKSGKEWVYAHRPNAKDVVVILPVINNKKVLFLKEERPPLLAENIAKYCIGLPAGLVGDERLGGISNFMMNKKIILSGLKTGETIEDAIKAELLEEAGLMADKIEIKTRKTASSAGCVSEIITIAIAYINNYNVVVKPADDGGVIVERILVDIEKIPEWLKEREEAGDALTMSTLGALYFLQISKKENI